MTERLHYADSLCLAFEARLVAQHEDDARGPALILDRSAFYPEAGGQMADHGHLLWGEHEIAVRDVQLEGDRVLHFVERVPEGLVPGTELRGSIDEARRRLHMAEHTGQHILSRALLDETGATTVSSRLGESGCTIDVDREALADEALVAVEARANDVIDRDVPIRAHFPAPEALEVIDLRKAPKVKGAIRVVEIGDVDATPCGGTHCLRTSQVGLVSLLGTERRKRRLRIHFAAGRKAREILGAQASTLRSLGRELSAAPFDVPGKLSRLQTDLKEALRHTGHLCAELSTRLLEEGGTQVLDLGEAPVVLVRELGKRASQLPGSVVIAATRSDDELTVLAARGEGASFDCGAYIKALRERSGGRGGGQAHRAEGRFPVDAPFERLARDLT